MRFVKRQYVLSWYFFKNRLQRYFWGASILFFGAALATGMVIARNPQLLSQLLEAISATFTSKGVYRADGGLSLVAVLFGNIRATATTALMGLVPFLFLPLFSLGVNAAILGVLGAAYTSYGAGLFTYLMGILPHGIFELPAIVLSCALGAYLCFELVCKLVGQRRGVPFTAVFVNALRLYLTVAVPLLLIAAPVEVYITPHIFALFL